MSVKIRDYKMNDCFSLLSLSDDEWKSQIISTAMSIKENSEVERCLVAELGGAIIGFIYGFVLPNKTLIPEFMYVKPSARKSGVGTELVKQLEIRSNCTTSMIFYNKTLHSYYKKQGYQAGDNLEVAIKEIGGNRNEV